MQRHTYSSGIIALPTSHGRFLAGFAAMLLAVGCHPGGDSPGPDAAQADSAAVDGAVSADSTADSASVDGPDSATAFEAGPESGDATAPDASSPDGEVIEGGGADEGVDSTSGADAVAPPDAAPDAGAEAAGASDAGPVDGGPDGAIADGGSGDAAAAAYFGFESQGTCMRWRAQLLNLTQPLFESNTTLYAQRVDGVMLQRTGTDWTAATVPGGAPSTGIAATDGVLYAEFTVGGTAGMYQDTPSGWVGVGNAYRASSGTRTPTAQPDGTLWQFARNAVSVLWRYRAGVWTSFPAPMNASGWWDTGTRQLLSTPNGLLTWSGSAWTPLVAMGTFGGIAGAAGETFVVTSVTTTSGTAVSVVPVTATGIDASAALTLPSGCTGSGLSVAFGRVHTIAQCGALIRVWRRDAGAWTTLPSFDTTGLSLQRGSSAQTPQLFTVKQGTQAWTLRLTAAGIWDRQPLVSDTALLWGSAAAWGGHFAVPSTEGIWTPVGTVLVQLPGTASWNVDRLLSTSDGFLYAVVATPTPSAPRAQELRRFDGTSWTTVAQSASGGTMLLDALSASDVWWITSDSWVNENAHHGGTTGPWTTTGTGNCRGSISPTFSGQSVGLLGNGMIAYLCISDINTIYYGDLSAGHGGRFAIQTYDQSLFHDASYVGTGSNRMMLVPYIYRASPIGSGTLRVESFDGTTFQSWASGVLAEYSFGPSIYDARYVSSSDVVQQLSMGTPNTVFSNPLLQSSGGSPVMVDPTTLVSSGRYTVVTCSGVIFPP